MFRDMALTRFHLTTQWTLTAAPPAVWDALAHPEAWPSWWRAVERVELIEPGVEVAKPWMRLIAPLARPVFAWNHAMVMDWGRQGLERLLAAN